MSRQLINHPEPGELLAYADGELRENRVRGVARHLCDCEQCRGWLEEIERGVAEYRRSLHKTLRESLPAPPKPWFDIEERLTELDAERVQQSRRPPLGSPLSWAVAAAGLVIGLFSIPSLFEHKVSAAELLNKASERQPASVRRRLIRVQTRSGALVRPALWSRRGAAFRERDQAAALQGMFAAANYSWEDPLSAQSYAAWSNSLPSRRDEVNDIRSSGRLSAYEIRTTTDHGELTEARLTLRASDLHPVREKLHFRNQEWVEIAELQEDAPEPERAAPVLTAKGGIERREQAPANSNVSPADELRVWAALHRLEADLGEPITVEREPSRILVSALAPPPGRRAALEEALSGIRGVELRFDNPQPVRPATGEAQPRSKFSAEARPEVAERLGDQGRATEFINQMLESSDSALVRAHAIRRLAEHFPPESEQALNAGDRSVLRSMLRDHIEVLREARLKVSAALRELAQRAPPDLSPPSPAAWQAGAIELVQSSEAVDRLLNQLLAAQGSGQTTESLLEQLKTAIGRWGASIEATQTAVIEME